MKTRTHPIVVRALRARLFRILSLAGGLALSSFLAAHAGQEQKPGTTAPKPPPAKQAPATAVPTKGESKATAPAKKVVLTGSRIPRRVQQHGAIADTGSSVIVIDRKDLDRSGAMTIADALRRLPFR